MICNFTVRNREVSLSSRFLKHNLSNIRRH